jgi:hypothetical protein
MAKLRTLKCCPRSLFTGLLAVGFYALAQAHDEGKRDGVAGPPRSTLPATLETPSGAGRSARIAQARGQLR